MLVTVIALDVRQSLDVGEPTARACLAEGCVYIHEFDTNITMPTMSIIKTHINIYLLSPTVVMFESAIEFNEHHSVEYNGISTVTHCCNIRVSN